MVDNIKPTISYIYDDLINYQQNDILENMLPYIIKNKKNNNKHNLLKTFEDVVNSLINSKMLGIKHDDLQIYKKIKTCVNSLGKTTYNENIMKLLKIKFNDQLLTYLINELIMCSIKSNVAIQCKILQKNQQINEDILPILCCNIILDININYDIILQLILNICNDKFTYFMNINIDDNNIGTFEDYKGFMTLCGLFYYKNILNFDIILNYLTYIYTHITKCNQLYVGYDYLLQCVLYKLYQNKTEIKNELVELITLHSKFLTNNIQLKQIYILTHNKRLLSMNQMNNL